MMYFNQYTTQAKKTAVFPKHTALEYLTLGLASEAGEVAGKVKKHLRGDYGRAEMQEKVKCELGGVLWYLAMLADEAGTTLEDCAVYNLKQLMDRQDRGVLKGDGDHR
ncbi:nucleoside triphosphate pyrophosphohydrolase family protein [Shimia sp.]|uniref:nucleoside triphosphate pyrophosphohydrolase family protein n=1 Tax=Shimia sp. TaxID=1954381 RepID=UPI003BAA427F